MRISDWSSDVCSSDLVEVGALMQRHREFDTAISAADVEHMQRSHGALAEHEFDLSNFARILHDSAFEVAAGGHDDALGRGQRPEARQRLYIAVPPGQIGRAQV